MLDGLGLDLDSSYTLWLLLIAVIGSFVGAWLGVYLAVRSIRVRKAYNAMQRRRKEDRIEDYNTGEHDRISV